MRPILDSVKEQVRSLWLGGMTYRQIHAQLGLSIGVISDIIQEHRERLPDIDDLRKLHLALREIKADLPDALRGAQFLRRLDELDFDSKDLPRTLNFIAEAKEHAPELASAGSRVTELEKKAGKPYEQFLQEFEAKLKAEADLATRVKGLADKELELRSSIRHLEKLRTLQETIDKNNLTPIILEGLIRDGLKLQTLGFTPQQAEILRKALAQRGLDPVTASAQVATLLREHSDLTEAKEKAEAEAKNWASQLETAKNSTLSLQKKIRFSEEELKKLEETCTTRKGLLEKEEKALEPKLKAKYDGKNRELSSKHDDEKQKLEAELSTRKQEIESQIHDLQNQATTLRTEVQNLESARANISEAEAALHRIEEAIGNSRMLGVIVRLIKNPTTLRSPSDVREAMHAILKGFETYLETSSFIGWKKWSDLKTAIDRLAEESR